jgi:hypothetical protein
MNEVPSIGGARGIFEIFVPGAFLFLNIAGVVYLWPVTGAETRLAMVAIASEAVPSLAILVCFGYLIGVLLRLLKTRAPDRWSGYLGWVITKLKRKDGRAFLEEFPYFRHIEKVATNRLPDEAREFYRQFWGKRAEGGNREFFNYCKTIINAIDERSAAEAYAAEALTRYVASMFYALLISVVLVAALVAKVSEPRLITVAAGYFIALFVILRHLRFLRVKEVETVFGATLRNYTSGNWPRITRDGA